MGELHGRPAAPVHLGIDMQRMFGLRDVWAAPWLERVLPNVVKLCRHAPAHGIADIDAILAKSRP